MPFTGSCSAQIGLLQQKLEEAQAVVVGAGAGLSASAGLIYGGERFERHFADFIAKYHFCDMYEAGFYPYPTPEEYWAYWSRHIYLNRYAQPPGRPYRDLLALLGKKDYFVLTTNVDHCFQLAGFDKARLFYTQGDYGLFQCAKPCRQETYGNEGAVRQMVERQGGMRIPTALIPRCPVCGGPMRPNLRIDGTFVEDAGWHRASARYAAFLREHRGKRVLLLELGAGFNTPGIIKYPFWQMAHRWPDATYACLNLGQACAPQEIAANSICLGADIGAVLGELLALRAGTAAPK